MSGILRNTRNRWFSAGNGVRLMLLLLLASCTGGNRKEMNRRVTLRRNDDAPYGARIAYEGLAWIFPDADISVLSLSPQAFTSGEEKKAIITLATDVEVSPAEVTAIMNFVGEGNQLFISSFRVSDTLLRVLGIRTSYKFRFMDE